ncbi:MAG: AMP-binding protein, partial [Microbacterium sp.]
EVPAGTAVVLTTSGSTGVPKSVALSRNALTASALATAARVGEGQWLLALPATRIAGLQVLVRSLIQGTEPAILSGHFTPAAFAHITSAMHSSRGGERVPTYTSLVPAQLQALLDDDEGAAALATFEAVLVGGQSVPLVLREKAEAKGVRIVRTYGSTETAGGCVYDGIPLQGVRVRSQQGELQIAGPTLADGYLGDDERTAEAFVTDADGVRWYRTGDAGAVTDGAVTVTGRLDNVIISGGVNVSLDQIERVLHEVPGFGGCVVVGVPDERWGETPVVVTTGAPELDAARAVVEAALGKAARPSRIVIVNAIPHLPSGKPDRRALTDIVRA